MTLTVTARGVAQCACWIIGFGLGVAAVVTETHLGGLAVFFVAIAAVLTIRGFLNEHAANWTTAYEIGREVRRIRRVPAQRG